MSTQVQPTKESIASIKITAGNTGGTKTFTPPAGNVIGCVIVPKGGDNPGMIRAGIKNTARQPISEMQAIENYKIRDCAYLDGCKPLNITTDGQEYYLDIQASEAMQSEFNADLIFIFAAELSC